MSSGFETAFTDVERAAKIFVEEAQRLVKAGKALERAAREGNLVARRRAEAALKGAVDTVLQGADNASRSWTFTDDQESAYLTDGYAEELVALADQAGLKMKQEGARLLVYPSVLRVQVSDRSLKIDRKAVKTLRPLLVVTGLKAAQAKPSTFKGAKFLEQLHGVYEALTRNNQTSTVLLAEVYRLWADAPGSDYTREEFARDLYLLRTHGPDRAKGYRVAFPASVGTRSPASSKLFQTINEHGETQTFYGLQFIEGKS